MKLLLSVLSTLALSAPAFAGVEVHYRHFKPFSHTLTLNDAQQASSARVSTVRLTQVPTEIKAEIADFCADEQPQNCDKYTVLKSVPAIEIVVTYDVRPISNDDLTYAQEPLYVDPSTVSSQTLQILQAHKSLSGSLANQVVALERARITVPAQEVDNKNSTFCDSDSAGYCVEKVSYISTTARATQIRASLK